MKKNKEKDYLLKIKNDNKTKEKNKVKEIIKFTFKNTFFSKIFILTNILMIFVVIFLTNIVCKLALASNPNLNSSNDITYENEYDAYYDENNYDENINFNDEEFISEINNENYENNESVNIFNVNAVNTITNTFNGGFVLAFILFFVIYFYGYMVSNSVSEEKTSRVIENLMMNASPKEIVIGKTIAMGYLSVMQMFEMLIVFLLTTVITMKIDLSNLFNNIFEMKSVSESFDAMLLLKILLVMVILFSYFIFGYLFYAFICAIAGAGVDKAEDVQMVNGPISILAMIGFYFSVLSSSIPNNRWVPIAKYLPFSSPFAMPVNIINGTTNLFEMILSLAILIACAIWLGFIAIKVYKHVIFNYGRKTTFKDVLKIIFFKK